MARKSGPVARGSRVRRPSRAVRGAAANRAIRYGVAAGAAAVLAACGSTGGGGGTGGGAGAPASTAPGHQAAGMLSSRSLPGLGAVLVDSAGQTVYSPEQEASGTIRCTGGCLSFWLPVKVAPAATLSAASGVTGTLGKIHRRDDGVTQLTYDGQPLYTFQLDRAPGQAKGNDFSDKFGGVAFTWHALTPGGKAADNAPSGGSGGGYGDQGGGGY